jgi:hypothetical protein
MKLCEAREIALEGIRVDFEGKPYRRECCRQVRARDGRLIE